MVEIHGNVSSREVTDMAIVASHGPALNPMACRKTKFVYNFGLSECNRAKKELSFYTE